MVFCTAASFHRQKKRSPNYKSQNPTNSIQNYYFLWFKLRKQQQVHFRSIFVQVNDVQSHQESDWSDSLVGAHGHVTGSPLLLRHPLVPRLSGLRSEWSPLIGLSLSLLSISVVICCEEQKNYKQFKVI